MAFSIRDLNRYEEMDMVRQLQRRIWGWSEPDMGLYPPVLNTAAKNGGVVLGAFDDATGQMIAFLFSFLGRAPGGPLKLCSQTMGVLQEWRGRGVAEALKWVQRERALVQDLPLITWTFDPLEAPNAWLNLRKLGAVCRTYYQDMYGSNFGALNTGMPTDRLLAEWWIMGNRASARRAAEGGEPRQGTPVFQVSGRGAERRIVETALDLAAASLELEIPAGIHPLKAANIELAREWRMQVRQAFEAYLERGYIATDFISSVEQGERRNRYLLQKATPQLIAEIGITQ